jgi:hypothetical protein
VFLRDIYLTERAVREAGLSLQVLTLSGLDYKIKTKTTLTTAPKQTKTGYHVAS